MVDLHALLNHVAPGDGVCRSQELLPHHPSGSRTHQQGGLCVESSVPYLPFPSLCKPMGDRETGDEASAGAVSAPQDIPPTPAPSQLSVTAATILAAAGRSGGNDPTADHFVPLPGGEDELESSARQPRYEPFKSGIGKPAPASAAAAGHGIPEASGDILGSNNRWGVEGLLGSKTAAKSGRGFAASAKSTIASGFERLTAARGRSADCDGDVEQPCEYVAMTTPCESPVNKVRERARCGLLL